MVGKVDRKRRKVRKRHNEEEALALKAFSTVRLSKAK